jgi:hypothetical protein
VLFAVVFACRVFSTDKAIDIDTVRSTVVHEAAIAQGNNAAHGVDKGQFMCGNYHSGPVRSGVSKKLEKGFLAGSVETDEGFINEQQIKRTNEAKSDC